MGHLYFILALGALVLLFFAVALAKRLAPRYRHPYVAETTLFSPQQRAFLAVLERAVGRGFRVYGRVRVSDVVHPRRRLDRHTRRRAWERLGQRTFDFLVCTAGTGAIACAVSLAPRSRLGLAPPRDELDRICVAAGVPFVRFREADLYSVVEVEERVFAAMQSVGPGAAGEVAGKPDSESAPTSAATESLADTQETLQGLSAAIAEGRGDPDGRPSVRRKAPDTSPARRPELRPVRRALPEPSTRPSPQSSPRPSARVSPDPPQVRPRAEPTLAVQGDIDEGPTFTIRDDLDDDESPARWRRA